MFIRIVAWRYQILRSGGIMTDGGYPDNPVRPYIDINTNQVVYLDDYAAGGRDDIRRIRLGEKIASDTSPVSPVTAPQLPGAETSNEP
jgi:hypothetical protein